MFEEHTPRAVRILLRVVLAGPNVCLLVDFKLHLCFVPLSEPEMRNIIDECEEVDNIKGYAKLAK